MVSDILFCCALIFILQIVFSSKLYKVASVRNSFLLTDCKNNENASKKVVSLIKAIGRVSHVFISCIYFREFLLSFKFKKNQTSFWDMTGQRHKITYLKFIFSYIFHVIFSTFHSLIIILKTYFNFCQIFLKLIKFISNVFFL